MKSCHATQMDLRHRNRLLGFTRKLVNLFHATACWRAPAMGASWFGRKLVESSHTTPAWGPLRRSAQGKAPRSVAAVIALCAASACTTNTDLPSAGPADPGAFESAALMALVTNLRPRAHWIDGEDRFWMQLETGDGSRFVVVDAATGKQVPAFDHARLAASLAEAGLANAAADNLPITSLGLGGAGIVVTTASGAFNCSRDAAHCARDETPPPSPGELDSPDGKRTAFVRDANLWVRERSSGRETQLTTDGEDGFAYGHLGFELSRVQRRRLHAPKPITSVNWSPDGRHIAAMRVDLRAVPMRSYVKEHLPPDLPFTAIHFDRVLVAAQQTVPAREIAVIDTETGRMTRADIAPDRLQDFAPMHFAANVLWWNLGGRELFFVTADPGGQTYGIAAMNLDTGAVRTVVEENETHFYAFSARDYHAPNFHVTTDGSEALWYSQRSGAGQLYLYDAGTGALKNTVTDGGVVFDIIRVDESARVVYFTAGGRESGRNPYYPHLYRVSFDGGDAELLTPENAAHDFYRFALPVPVLADSSSKFSPSGEYFVDVFSTIEQPPTMVIRKRDGGLVAEVLRADASRLEATGWQPPERFVVKAADGETDLYGALFKPLDFDPGRKYAVVDQTYPGPQIDSGPHTFLDNFAAITTRNAQATAQAGFIVATLDGRGTTRRDRAFRYAFSGTEDAFGAADHKAAIENLARERPYMDTSRVGITGASFGGYGSLRAALLFPDFFDVVVSHVGPHEYLHSVTSGISVERFFGVPGGDRDLYELTSNIAIIDRLQADLMLVYGEIDENVPFRAAMAIFDALIKADKDFTSYVVPNADHGGAAAHPYIVERQRQFFVEHLGHPKP